VNICTPQIERGKASPASPGLILGLMSACVVMTVALVAAVNLAIPKLSASSLHPSAVEVLWVVDSYLLVFACLLIPAGALGDRYGRKGALLVGLAIFGGGCLLAGVAPDVAVLLAGRALSGAGAALVMPATLSLIVQSSAPERRSRAIATWTLATGVAGIVGNVGGGVVLEYLSWRVLFWVLAPVAVALLGACARYAPAGERHPAALDLVGSALVMLSFFALMYGIIEGPNDGWTSAAVLGAFGIAVAVGAFFVWVEMRSAHPLIDPRIFGQPGLRAGTLSIGVIFFGLFALFFVNAQYLQYAKHYSPVGTGIAIVPLALGMLAVSRASVTIAVKIGPSVVVTAGLVILAAGLLGLSWADARTPYLLYAALLVAVSVGMGLSAPSGSTAIIGSLPAARAGLGSGLNSATRELGSALGIAIVGTIIDSRFFSRLPAGLRHVQSAAQAIEMAKTLSRAGQSSVIADFTDAMDIGYRTAAATVFVLAVVVLVWFRQAAE
jgi:EmrB/QacA subfamily drug resistance transporter